MARLFPRKVLALCARLRRSLAPLATALDENDSACTAERRRSIHLCRSQCPSSLSRWRRGRFSAGRFHCVILFGLLLLGMNAARAVDGSRIKDLAIIAGARDNQLVGYGLVVGLAGDGDKNSVFTLQTIANSLLRFKISIPAATLNTKNVAAVMVTADIPAFKKPGSRIDVVVGAMGDAKSLQGGVLLQTPLFGADGEVYAVAQGPLSIGGLSAGPEGAGGATVQKNHPTVGQIIDGAIVEKEIPAEIVHNNQIELLLRESDFTSSARMSDAINLVFPNSATALDSGTVRVMRPSQTAGSWVDFIARVESIEVQPDIPARIVINERTGTIVATARIRVSSCAVAQGNLTITVASTLDVSQPNPLSQTGQTQTVPRTNTQVTEQKGSLVPLPELPSIEKIAAALNALGVTPRDMMSIFQAMKQAGALHAELVLH